MHIQKVSFRVSRIDTNLFSIQTTCTDLVHILTIRVLKIEISLILSEVSKAKLDLHPSLYG